MAKFQEASTELGKLFDEVRDKTSIPQWVEFRVLGCDKQKEVCKIFRANDLVQVLTEGVNFAVVINEEIFGQLPEDMQKMVFDECLAGVTVSDSDVVGFDKPDFNTYTGVLQKYGDNSVIAMHESVKSLFDAKKQKEDQKDRRQKRRENQHLVFA